MNAMKRSIAALTAAAIGLGTLGLAAAPALAAPDPGVAKQEIERKIDERLARLSLLHTKVDDADRMTEGDRSTLGGILDSETSGLTALRAQVDAATDAKTVAGYAKSMVGDYRVYMVVTPQVHLTIGSDAVGAITTQLVSTLEPKLDDAIAKAKAAGKDTAAAEAANATVKADVAAAAADVEGLSATLVALTPHGYPANEQAMVDARAKLTDARAKLADARTAAHQVVDALKTP
jgi:hypothetical protein